MKVLLLNQIPKVNNRYALNLAEELANVGIKVWICKGLVYGKRELVPSTVGGNIKEGGRAGAQRSSHPNQRPHRKK